jgi:hypothetical protein
VYSVFVVIIFIDILKYLKIGIRALSLARSVGNLFFYYFCRFFRRRKKKSCDIPDDLCRFWFKIFIN